MRLLQWKRASREPSISIRDDQCPTRIRVVFVPNRCRDGNCRSLTMCINQRGACALPNTARGYDQYWWRVSGSRLRGRVFRLRVEEQTLLVFRRFILGFLLREEKTTTFYVGYEYQVIILAGIRSDSSVIWCIAKRTGERTAIINGLYE